MEKVELDKDKSYLIYINSTDINYNDYLNLHKILLNIGIDNLVVNKDWFKSKEDLAMKKSPVDNVNCCKYYSIENLVSGFDSGDVEYPIFEEVEFCNKPGCLGYCPYSGFVDECEVLNNEEE